MTQRHVQNALALGHEVSAFDFRASTPLKWGQVDDTPFGGGAGMVLRVDVMDAALRDRYGVDPVQLPARRRVIALTPAGRLLDDALAGAPPPGEGVAPACGRPQGVGERVLPHLLSAPGSVGPY